MMAQHVPRDDPMNEDDEEELEALEAAANAALAAADALMNPSVLVHARALVELAAIEAASLRADRLTPPKQDKVPPPGSAAKSRGTRRERGTAVLGFRSLP